MIAGVALAGCAAPDHPPALADPLPARVTTLLHPDSVRGGRVGAGVWYRYLWSPVGPWAIHLLEGDLSRCDVSLAVLQARGRTEGGAGRERVSSMVAREARPVLGAVNGDFFTPEGRALGSEVVHGRVTIAHERPTLGWKPGSEPWVGPSRVVGDSVLALGWPVRLRDGDRTSEAVGGFPELLAQGRRVGDLGVSERPGFSASRHPRTAVGYDSGRRRLWLVVVDGRQPPYSAGMTLPELAELLEALGADEAINLDGGGSSVMVVRGRVRNRPSDKTGERPVVNALAMIRDPAACRRPARRAR